MIKRLLTFISIALFLFSCSSNKSHELSVKHKKAKLHYQHGTGKLINREYTAALDHLLKAEKFNSEDSKIQNNLGMAYYFKGELRLAETHLLMSIGLDGKNSDARNNLASLYYNQKKYSKAEKQYRIIAKDLVYNKQFRVLYNLSLIELKKDRVNEAKILLNKSIAEKKDYCIAHLKLGQLEESEHQYQKALSHYRSAISGNCYNYPAPHYYLGNLYIQLQKPIAAQQKFRTLLRKFPDSHYAKISNFKLKEIRDMEFSKLNPPTKTINRKNESNIQSF